MRKNKLLILSGLFLIAWFLLSSLAPNAIFGLFVRLAFGLPFLALLVYPLFFLNTVFLYFEAALPAWLLLRRAPRNWFLIALAAGLLPLVGFGVPYGSQLAAGARERQLRAADFAENFATPPQSVEIVEREYGGLRNDPLLNAPCTAACQRILLTGRVETLRVTRRFMSEHSKPIRQMDYALERQQTCPRLAPPEYDLVPQALEAAAAGRCIVSKAVDPRPMEARIAIEETYESQSPQDLIEDVSTPARALRVKTLEIVDLRGGAPALRLRQTEADLSWWQMPLSLDSAPCGAMCAGKPIFNRTIRTQRRIDTAELALRTFGLDAGSTGSD